ncbi:MAG: lactate racemase domain-containing protein [Clostridia bacterium]|nr:lactate racemase domain-containing protein [Clostridia bacterium]
MSIYDELLKSTILPKMALVSSRVERGTIEKKDIPSIIERSVNENNLLDCIMPGQSVAIGIGSREINHIDVIIKSLVNLLLGKGAKPFLIPAMGSHGGATAEGQRQLIEGFGINERTMGVPIICSMQTRVIGRTAEGLEVNVDENAFDADWMIPVGRIKPHTDFRGVIESGLMKMLTIGFGKQRGANLCHSHGFDRMSYNVTQIARVILASKHVPFGIAIVEDAFHGTYALKALPAQSIEEEEAKLLVKAKTLIPRIPFKKVDVLVLDRIGKDISGAGMDPNITGRSSIMGISQPFIERIAVLDLSEASHGNGCGIGGADITTRRFYGKMDLDESYPNAITSHDPASMKIPPIMHCDRDAIRMAIQTCVHIDPAGCRMVWMPDTLHFSPYRISQALLDEARSIPDLDVISEPEDIVFDESGNVPWL